MPTVLWSHRSPEEKEAHKEIERSSDRAAAILSAAFVEDRLSDALKARLHQDKKITEEMFRPSGPLGSFSSKIGLAFMIGMLSKETVTDLYIIKDVRNEFAHRLTTKDFESPRVRSLIGNLTTVKKKMITMTGESGESLTLDLAGVDSGTQSERQLFIAATQYFIFLLDHMSVDHPLPATPGL